MKNVRIGIAITKKWAKALQIDMQKLCYLCILLIMATILSSSYPLIFGILIDVISSPRKAAVIISLFAAATILGNILNYFTQRIQFLLVTSIEANAKKRIFQKILTIPYEEYTKMEKGKFVNTLEKDAEVFSRILSLIVSLGVEIASVFVVSVIMLRINWKLTILFFIAFPVNLLIFKRFGNKIKEKTEESKQTTDKYLTFVNEVLINIKTIKIFQSFPFMERVFNQNVQKTYDCLDKRNYYNRKGSLIIQLINSFLDISIIALGIEQIYRGVLTIGRLVSFQTYSGTLNRYLLELSVVNADIQEIKISLNRIKVILDNTERKQNVMTECLDESCFRQDIRIESVSFSYDNSTYILREADLVLKQNQITTIAGQNGCGKSTLLNLMSVFYKNYTGNIYFGDTELREVDEAVLYENICFVFQQTSLFTLSLRDNLLLGKPDASDRELEAVCRKVLLWDFICSLPDGLDTVAGEKGMSLSEGQKQKIVIARALLAEKRIYLLDEITANLDTESEAQICKLLSSMKKDCTIVNVSHRKKLLEITDTVYELRDGHFVDGSTYQ